MTPDDLYNEIMDFCKLNADENIVKKYSRYFKDGQYDSYGITQLLLESKVKEILRKNDSDFQLIRDTARLLVSDRKYEAASFAITLYKSFIKEFNKDTFGDIAYWYETGISNWAHSDYICGELIYPLLKKNIIDYSDFGKWIYATNKFQRRSVPVSLIKTLKSKNDYLPYFNLIEPLMEDAEREVHQGVGWFLREAWKRNNEMTELFMLKYKDISARLIFQYACEKMSADEKIRFKRTK